MRRPYYYSADSLHLLLNAGLTFYLRLADKRILGSLNNMKKIGKEYEELLGIYPEAQYEALDLFYCCRKGMCSLNNELLQDLLFSFSWREANWGAWLAALAPNPFYIPHLKNRAKDLPHGKEVIKLALASCGEPVMREIEEQYLLLKEIQSMLERIPIIKFPLRKWIKVDQELALDLEIEAYRKAYHDGSISIANFQHKKSLLNIWGQIQK